MSSPEIVIALYRPHAGKEKDLEALVARHLPTLRESELITPREAIAARASDGTILEVFEWASGEAASQAHEVPAVAKVWEAMAQVADFVSLGSLPEAGKRFPHFAPLRA